MKWSWKVGEFRGIGVYVHATFLILLAFIVMSYWAAGKSLASTIEGVGFIIALFACVVLHEFGHALTAARFGIKTQDITLLPIGGLARLERMPNDPMQELWVALAGPAVNVAIAAAIFVWLTATSAIGSFQMLGVTAGPFLLRLMAVNIFLVIFNMLPAFPMDGGRVLRALLATRLEYTRATQIAANVGQAMALLFVLAGLLLPNPFLLFIALFVWIGAGQEASLVMMTSSLAGIPVARAMITKFCTLSPEEPLSRAIDEILAGSQQDFPVVAGNDVVGILTGQQLLASLSNSGPTTAVGDVMHRDFEAVDPAEMLEVAFRRLQTCNCRTMPVLHRGQLVGLMTMDNIGEFVAIRAALSSGSSDAQRGLRDARLAQQL
jgi:Zn-dependent protease/predicted transcriptional regulator